MIRQNSVPLVTVCSDGLTLMDPHHGIRQDLFLFLSRSALFVSLRFTDAVPLSVINVFFIKRGQKQGDVLLIINSRTQYASDLRPLNAVNTSAFRA